MKKNIGTIDRIGRVIIGLAIAELYRENYVSGTSGIIFLVIAGILALTGLIGFSPIYKMLGFNSGKLE